MRAIYKYPVAECNTHNIIDAPIVKPLYVEYQNGDPYLWAVVDTEKEPIEWLVSCVGTGIPHDSNIDLDSYLNTTVESSKPFVWHWFCRKYIQGFDL